MIPTDTIYGIVCSAMNKKSVERVYRLRKRDKKKPMIILINSIRDIKMFGVLLDGGKEKKLEKIWPGKVSVILECRSKKFSYLHRGGGTLALRLPRKPDLRDLLKKTGPLVAPSANIEGMEPSRTIKEAKGYFGKAVDLYIDGGRRAGKPSKLVEFTAKNIKILRV